VEPSPYGPGEGNCKRKSVFKTVVNAHGDGRRNDLISSRKGRKLTLGNQNKNLISFFHPEGGGITVKRTSGQKKRKTVLKNGRPGPGQRPQQHRKKILISQNGVKFGLKKLSLETKPKEKVGN